MLSLDQIKLLETKVDIALKKILELQSINATLKSQNDDLQIEIGLLKEQYEKNGQEEELIEKGILSVIDRLNFVEDAVRQSQINTDSTPTTPIAENQIIEEDFLEEPDEIIEPSLLEAEINIPTEPTEEPKGMLNHATFNQAETSAQLDIF